MQAVFLLCLATLVYTYAGYPLLLVAWARLRPRSVQRALCEPAVTVIVIAHNEAARIGAKIQTCLAQDYPQARLRVLVVSDGSDDGTDTVVKAYPGGRVRLLAYSERRGKAACLNDAIATCEDEILVLTDARQRLDREAVRSLVQNFADPGVGAVSGELVFGTEGRTDFGEGVDAYWRYEKFIRECESTVGSVVGVTGALYALRRTAFRPIPANVILDDVLIPMNVVIQGARVLLDRHALAWDEAARSPEQERVRKVRTLAGNFQLIALRPELLLPWRNPIFLQFVSHKVLRLAAPPLLLLTLASNSALAASGTTWAGLLAAQLAGYLAAFAAQWVPALRRRRAFRLLHSFVILNGFVVLGFIEFVSNRNAHLWRTAGNRQGLPT